MMSFVKVINLILQLIKHAIIIPSNPQCLGLDNKNKYSVASLKHWLKKKKIIVITKACYFKPARGSVK